MPADPARIAIAKDLLTQLGVTLADLHDGETPTAVVPTLADYLPCVIEAAGSGANRTYGSYWTRMVSVWGARPLDQISASDIEAMQHQMAATARSRRNSRHGRHAGEHVIAAARAIYNRAIADGLIEASASPAHRVTKPRRLPSTRRALTAHELDQINAAARGERRLPRRDPATDRLLRYRTAPAPPPRHTSKPTCKPSPQPYLP